MAYSFAGVTMIGPGQNVIKSRAIRVAPNMVNAKMGPACAVKDGMEDTAHYVRRIT